MLVTSRSFAEYRDMFDLNGPALDGSVLDCCAGSSSFVAELVAGGGTGVAVDPAYAWPRAELAAAATARFLADRDRRPGNYVAAALPHLPFADVSLDLVVCSHLLFTWADVLDAEWHLAAITEMSRVARREVRIFPLVVQGTGERVPFFDALLVRCATTATTSKYVASPTCSSVAQTRCSPSSSHPGEYHRERVRALADLKTALEETPMTTTEFVYTTYIKTTPERLWQALTDPAFTRRYWGVTFESDWTVGSTMIWEERGTKTADPDQVVLEYERHRRLAYSWHTFTPEWAESVALSDEDFSKVSSERRSKVTFDIEPLGQVVKLTVIHDDFDPGSTVLEMVSQGWPELLSSLKTLLETGETLPASAETAGQEQGAQPLGGRVARSASPRQVDRADSPMR